jgi:hypothetical protein
VFQRHGGASPEDGGAGDDAAFKVGDRPVRLSEVRSIAFKGKAGVLLHDGKTVEGKISGLGAVTIRLGGEKVAVNLAEAEQAVVSRPSDGVTLSYTVVIKQDGKEVARLKRVSVIGEGAGKLYLSDLQEMDLAMGPWGFGKNGSLKEEKALGGAPPIAVNGKKSPKGLGMHPPVQGGFSSVKYRLDKKARAFNASVALDDSNEGKKTAVEFEVLGDGKSLWKSKLI